MLLFKKPLIALCIFTIVIPTLTFADCTTTECKKGSLLATAQARLGALGESLVQLELAQMRAGLEYLPFLCGPLKSYSDSVTNYNAFVTDMSTQLQFLGVADKTKSILIATEPNADWCGTRTSADIRRISLEGAGSSDLNSIKLLLDTELAKISQALRNLHSY